MIKPIFTAALSLMMVTASSAQSQLQNYLRGSRPAKGEQLFNQILRAQSTGAKAKSTAQRQRIIGSSAFAGGILTDSARYVYGSALRGSNHTPNDLTSYDFGYYPTVIHFPDVEDVIVGGELDIRCDTAVFRNANGIYRTVGLQYNASQQPTRYYSAYIDPITGGSDGRERFTMTYNTNNQRTQMLAEVDTVAGGAAGNFIADYRMYSFYGGTPAVPLRDSFAPAIGAPKTTDAERWVYSYTGNKLSKIDVYQARAGVFSQTGRFLFTYDGSNRLRTKIFEIDLGSGLQLVTIDSVTYTGALLFPTGIYSSIYNGTTVEPSIIKRYTVNAQSLRDTLRIFSGTGSLLVLIRFQYDTYGNPTAYSLFDPATSTTVPAETGRYYYESHESTGIPPQQKSDFNATAYPNPVIDELALRWAPRQGSVTIQLADASGRILEYQHIAASSGTARLDMRRYASGKYFVLLRNQNGVALQHIKLIKQ